MFVTFLTLANINTLWMPPKCAGYKNLKKKKSIPFYLLVPRQEAKVCRITVTSGLEVNSFLNTYKEGESHA